MHYTYDDMREQLYTAVVCDALDSLGYRRQSPGAQFLPYSTGGRTLVGRCKTTLWVDMAHEVPNPFELELKAVDECRPDDVLIAATGGSLRSAIWGELLTTAAMNRGCVGAVIDGAVRDVAAISKLDFPLYARATSPYDSQNRQRVIEIDVPVEIGGVLFSPRDLVFADRDGVVIVPQQIEKEALDAAWEKVHGENKTRDSIRHGMTATEVYRRYGIL
jgi:regulator of RNase E activity RraA